jgi:hypothetical protein
MTHRRASWRSGGLTLAEVAFILLGVGILLGLLIPAYLASVDGGKEPGRTSRRLSRDEAQYLKYLTRLSDESLAERGEVVAAVPAAAGGGRRAGGIHVTGMELDERGMGVSGAPPGGVIGAGTMPALDAGTWPVGAAVGARATGEPADGAELDEDAVVIGDLTIIGTTGGRLEGAGEAGGGGGLLGGGGVLVVKPGLEAEAWGNRGDAADGQAAGAPGRVVLIGTKDGAGVVRRPSGITRRARSGSAPAQAAGRRRRVRLEARNRGPDLWSRWPDRHVLNLAGTQGREALSRAFDVLMQSAASAIAQDLFRKGIELSFGDASEFTGRDAGAAALLIYPPAARPPDVPEPPPILKLNPKYLHEDPRALAAVLAHEATHFQQFLDGTLLDASVSPVDVEVQAWTNGAACWQGVRLSTTPLNTPLVREQELAYGVVRQGERTLRDLIGALYRRREP